MTITGTAGDETGETEKGGVVAGVEVSVDDGTTWHPAAGRENWSYTWTPDALGAATIKARAVDDSGNIQPTAAQITVEVEPRSCPCSIWEGNLSAPADADSNSVELGLKFRSDTDGFITGVRFYKASENFGPHSGRLWTSGGTLLGQVTFTGESASGWQQADFEIPIAIQAGTTYVVSYHAPSGHYSAIKNFFSLDGTDNPPLHALADGIDGGNGVFNYGPAGGLFSEGGPHTFEAANYLVDPVFTEEVEEDTTPPVVTSRIPIAGAIEVDPEIVGQRDIQRADQTQHGLLLDGRTEGCIQRPRRSHRQLQPAESPDHANSDRAAQILIPVHDEDQRRGGRDHRPRRQPDVGRRVLDLHDGRGAATSAGRRARGADPRHHQHGKPVRPLLPGNPSRRRPQRVHRDGYLESDGARAE